MPWQPPIDRGAASVHAAVFASALRIAVAPDAEGILPDVGTAKGLPLLLARAYFGELLLGRWLRRLRLPMLPSGNAGSRSTDTNAVRGARAVGRCRRCGDRQRQRRRKPGQGHPCLQHCTLLGDPSAAPAYQNDAPAAARSPAAARLQGRCRAVLSRPGTGGG